MILSSLKIFMIFTKIAGGIVIQAGLSFPHKAHYNTRISLDKQVSTPVANDKCSVILYEMTLVKGIVFGRSTFQWDEGVINVKLEDDH